MKNLLIDLLGALPEVQRAAAFKRQKQACLLTGLAGSSKPAFFAALDQALGANGSLAVITASREEIRAYRRELNYFYPDLPMQELYPLPLPRVMAQTRSLELTAGRAAALRLLAGEERGIVFITAEALLQHQPRLTNGAAQLPGLELAVGENLPQKNFLQQLVDNGYERTQQVDALGQFAVRGCIIDIYPINCANPVRIEWLDEEIDALRSFDISSQRSLQMFSRLKIAPLVLPETIWDASIFDYCQSSSLVWLDEPVRVFSLLEKLTKEQREYADELFTPIEITEIIRHSTTQIISSLGHSYFSNLPALAVSVRGVTAYNKNQNLLLEDFSAWLGEKITPLIMLSSSIKARAFADNLHNYQMPAIYAEGSLKRGKINVTFGDLDHGFRFWDTDWLLLTEQDLFGMQKRKRLHSNKHQGRQLQYFEDIKAGDYVVHKLYGIGRYLGVENLENGGLRRDYLLIAYAGADRLYVPVDQVGLLHKYVGSDGSIPRLSKMGGRDWQRTTAKASKAITEMAEELVRLYAQRQLQPGHAFSPDTQLQADFEATFPFEETPDQLRAIAEIKADMEKPQPMDRLLCGDVGYGKTEVAIRAAFKCVLDGRQAAVLAPTTVLTQQHYLTIKERMASFGVEVAILNRFCTHKEQQQILDALAAGRIDVIIGTHRLLQPDVVFHKLGLLIIDEEQRFGVAQKEKIKQWRLGVDVLALSATPIPRTLHMALINTRDMSLIESPPEDRLPVETYVAEYNNGMIKEALERELRRGGRIYYVHNRIDQLAKIALQIQKLSPGISIKIAHGQMSEEELEDAMIAFYEGDCDLLLCTTIVENGLDVPLANTIIVEGAENFGLSQLYQMRGRVGRSSRLAYAYFIYRPNKVLSEVAEQRLTAIRDFTELGAGFKIAMRDLEIRGAGNLLGPQQHGHIAGIGFTAYCELLESTIRRLLNGESATPLPEPVLDIPSEAYIPDDYINDSRYKLEIYRRLAEMEYKERKDLLDEIIDRFGTPPREVENLWRLAALRGLCRVLKLRGISVRKKEIRLSFTKQAEISLEALIKLMDINNQKNVRMFFKGDDEKQLIFNTSDLKLEAVTWLEKTLPTLAIKEI